MKHWFQPLSPCRRNSRMRWRAGRAWEIAGVWVWVHSGIFLQQTSIASGLWRASKCKIPWRNEKSVFGN